MDLKKFLPGTGKKSDEEYYWALIIEPGWVQAGIWKIEDKTAQVVYSSQPVAWEEDAELVSASDTVLSAAIQSFPEESPEPTKTVFGVSFGWLKDGEISADHLDKIKKICTELSLTPVGFVVMPEAITHLIKSETGTPINSIVVGIYKQNLELSLFENGKLIGTTEIARSVSLSEDVVEGLSRLTSDQALPSKILVYDGREGDLEEARQELLKVDWNEYEKLKFLHSPKVEIVTAERKVFAVCLAGASELAGITSLTPQITPEAPLPEENVLKNIDTKEVDKNEYEDITTPEEMGFSMENVESLDSPIEDEPEMSSEKEDFGFEEAEISEDVSKDKKNSVRTDAVKNFGRNMSGLMQKMPKMKFSVPSFGSGSKPFIWGGLFLLIIMLLATVAWWFLPKASVIVFVAPKKLEENANLMIDPSLTDVDLSSKKVPGKIITTSVSGDKTADTTGTKTVGDKATGQVTIYRVGPQISLAGGTLLNGPDNLKFAISDSTTVASGSASTPGETNVSVTAQDIGAQYNLASGTTFSVANYSSSDMEAKNSSAFSGGSSREIQSVSKDDQANLLKSLTQELTDQGKEGLGSQINENEYLIAESLNSSQKSADFNHKIGDEAGSLKLNLDLDVSALMVEKSDLEKISEDVLKSKVSDGYVLNSSQLNYSFSQITKDGDKYTMALKITANLLPDTKSDEVKSKIKGRKIDIAKEYLQKAVPSFTRVEIKLSPPLPAKIQTLPHIEKNIELEFSADR